MKNGLVTALFFGIFSMMGAILTPRGILDPLFINPLISILPRLMIPILTFMVFYLFHKKNNFIAVVAAIIFGNLANTFFVYFSMYLLTKDKVEMLLGKPFGSVVLGLVGTSTLFKTFGVTVITVPIVLALQRYLKTNQ